MCVCVRLTLFDIKLALQCSELLNSGGARLRLGNALKINAKHRCSIGLLHEDKGVLWHKRDVIVLVGLSGTNCCGIQPTGTFKPRGWILHIINGTLQLRHALVAC